MFFVHSDTGWASGSGGALLRTVNGGTDWSVVATGTSENLHAIAMSGNNGIVVGNARNVLRTTDRGESWTHETFPTDQNYYSVVLVNDTIGWAGGDAGYILRTINGGVSWSVDFHSDSWDSYEFAFPALNLGWVGGDNGRIFHYFSGIIAPELVINLVDESIQLQWSKVEGAVSYQVFYAATPEDTYTFVETVPDTSYVLPGPTDVTEFYSVKTNITCP